MHWETFLSDDRSGGTFLWLSLGQQADRSSTSSRTSTTPEARHGGRADICAPTLAVPRRGARKSAGPSGRPRPAGALRGVEGAAARLRAAASTGRFRAGVWLVGLAGLFAYYASQLPPIDQLAVPKRPPNIAILAADGSLIANRGDTGGAAVRLSELPPYLPKAFVAIEDRRFYTHFGIDPIGIGRAILRDMTGAAAWRAARRSPSSSPRTCSSPRSARCRARSRRRSSRSGWSAIFEGPDPRTLSQPRLFRLGRLWRRSGGAEIFRQERASSSRCRKPRCSPG